MSFIKTLLAGFLLMLMTTTVAWSQVGQVTLTQQEMTLGEAIAEIEGQTRYKFAFDNTVLDRGVKVSFGRTQLELREVLDRMFDGTEFGYVVRNRLIAVTPRVNSDSQLVVRSLFVVDETKRLRMAGKWRPLSEPEIEMVDTTTVCTDEVRNDDAPSFTSRVVSIDSYTASKQLAFAVKTNLLYAAATLTPNLAVEFGLGRRSTVELSGSWNQWNRKGDRESNKKLNHYIIRPEYRYWLCERFTGHFVGADLFFGQYNIGQYDVPLIGFKKERRYEGYGWGGGIVYGYHLPFGKRWGLEFHLGVGVAQLEYDEYDCTVCVREYEKKSKTYVGPTRAGISLVFMIK